MKFSLLAIAGPTEGLDPHLIGWRAVGEWAPIWATPYGAASHFKIKITHQLSVYHKPMSYNQNKIKFKKIIAQANSANWLLRAYGRAISRTLTQRQRGGIARLGVISLTLVFFHFFPSIAIASYMSWEGFFSYDMFKEGASGITAFYWWAELFIIITAIYFVGFLYFIVEAKSKKNVWLPNPIWPFSIMVLINVIVFISLLLKSPEKFGEGFTRCHLFGIYLIASWAAIHVGIVLNSSAKAALCSLGLGVLILIPTAMLNPGTLALPYSLSLQFFGNGGGLPVSIKLAKPDATIEGKLVLASPEYIYLYPRGKKSLLVISRREVDYFSVNNLSGFGHKTSTEK